MAIATDDERSQLRVGKNLARGTPRPRGLLTLSAVVMIILVAPLIFLLIESQGAGVHNVWQLIWRSLTATLLWNTIRLTVVVTILCAIIGVLAAWCVERTDLPGRRVWAVLVVIPFAIPDFVVSFGWASSFTWVHGFRGAVLVMTLAVYPLSTSLWPRVFAVPTPDRRRPRAVSVSVERAPSSG